MMRKWLWMLSLLALLFSPLAMAAGKAIVLEINGPIGPATQDYITRGLATANEQHATAVIIALNTPGGLETSMRGINEAIITSPLPVIAYVTPSGARAASAGVFIMYASHLAAMSSGTNVGAASPVSIIKSDKTDKKELTVEEKKAVNDASAYMRSLAQLRGRNADWAELAVREAASISANEAKQLKVIDEVADTYPELLEKIDGHNVLVLGIADKIKTKDLQLEKIAADWRYDFLSFLTNPNIAYILMLVAMYGLFFELANPGSVLPGVAGLISLILVLYAFQLMPLNYTGLALIIVGIGFMLLEVYISSFGVVGVGGIVAFVIGSVMLFDTHDPHYQLAWSLIILMAFISSAFIFVLFTLAIRSHKRAVITGKEGLLGAMGVVVSIMNEQVIVRIAGELWEARTNHRLDIGEKVKITKVHGLLLQVEPAEKRIRRTT